MFLVDEIQKKKHCCMMCKSAIFSSSYNCSSEVLAIEIRGGQERPAQ